MTELTQSQASIDPTAQVDESATIGAGVRIGAYVVVGPGCVIGAGCELQHHATIVAHTTMGEGNSVHPFAVLGSDPQDKSYRPDEPGELVIGDRNTFREFVTIGRGNWNGPPTRIGSDCYLMNHAHVGHNAQVGDGVVMVNGATLAGHSSLGPGCVMSAFTTVHQFARVGRGVMFQAYAGVGMNVPPFVLLANTNITVGLNRVGLQRNPDISEDDQQELKRVYRAMYRDRVARPIEELCDELLNESWGWAAKEFLEFIRTSMQQKPPLRLGIVSGRSRATRGIRPS